MNTGGVESEANVTDIHEALHFDITENSEDAARQATVVICHLLTILCLFMGDSTLFVCPNRANP